MVTGYSDDHFITFANVKSLSSTSETKIIYVKYNLIKKLKPFG